MVTTVVRVNSPLLSNAAIFAIIAQFILYCRLFPTALAGSKSALHIDGFGSNFCKYRSHSFRSSLWVSFTSKEKLDIAEGLSGTSAILTAQLLAVMISNVQGWLWCRGASAGLFSQLRIYLAYTLGVQAANSLPVRSFRICIGCTCI